MQSNQLTYEIVDASHPDYELARQKLVMSYNEFYSEWTRKFDAKFDNQTLCFLIKAEDFPVNWSVGIQIYENRKKAVETKLCPEVEIELTEQHLSIETPS